MIQLHFWQLLSILGLVGVLLLAGVLIGAYAVFRTKREGHEAFIGPIRGNHGEVFSVDDMGEEAEEVETRKVSEEILQRNTDFAAQFAARLGKQ